MTNPDRLAPLSSYDFFAWLTVTRPPLMEGLFGAPYGVATREVADRVGFRPAGAAETIGHYLAALQAFIAAPPPAPSAWDAMQGWLTTDIDDEPLPVDFAGPEPIAPTHPGDRWPYHMGMPSVSWPVPPAEVLRPDRDTPSLPPFVPAFACDGRPAASPWLSAAFTVGISAGAGLAAALIVFFAVDGLAP